MFSRYANGVRAIDNSPAFAPTPLALGLNVNVNVGVKRKKVSFVTLQGIETLSASSKVVLMVKNWFDT